MHFSLSTAALALFAPLALASPRVTLPALAPNSTLVAALAPKLTTIAIPTAVSTLVSSSTTPAAVPTVPKPAPSTPPNTTVAEPFFWVRNFRAFVPSDDEPVLNAWISFSVVDGDGVMMDQFATRCAALFNGTFYSEYKYHSCERQADHPNDKVGFRVSEGFNEVVLKRQWRHGNMYLTGYAPEGTWWDEGKGGNVTVKSFGKIYEREADWKFTLDSVAG